MKTNLDLIRECDSFPSSGTSEHTSLLSSFYTLTHTSATYPTPIAIGYVPEFVFNALARVPISIKGELEVSRAKRTISAFTQPTEQERSAAVAATCDYWRKNKTFALLEGWRNELYPVYGPNNELLFNVERSASALFGVVTYGVHMVCYTRMTTKEQAESGSKFDFKMWIPRRSKQKQTYRGMLDNTVAGGIASGEDPFESLVREADEEASLPEDLVRQKTQKAGVVTYLHLRDSRAGGESGVVQPECQYIYDLELPKGLTPQIKDGEVECFYLWTAEEVQERLANNEFKPNCAMVGIEFFLRHGVLTKDNEKDYELIERSCHRKLEFPGPHRPLGS
ncbi:thiamine pyrophosphokinase-related protein-like protein [Amylocarpus encephaloides]|uniref:Thiamine pyrophosphokinase-related protein-like protein n=1 Tax=Amylocarpus encephaloides TaxID=45428 RepID=A0A9P7Y7X1_9HELO|nr:thiamine pyrophosphokinase-related protein-like protein [Amylocarpus encephaloides]